MRRVTCGEFGKIGQHRELTGVGSVFGRRVSKRHVRDSRVALGQPNTQTLDVLHGQARIETLPRQGVALQRGQGFSAVAQLNVAGQGVDVRTGIRWVKLERQFGDGEPVVRAIVEARAAPCPQQFRELRRLGDRGQAVVRQRRGEVFAFEQLPQMSVGDAIRATKLGGAAELTTSTPALPARMRAAPSFGLQAAVPRGVSHGLAQKPHRLSCQPGTMRESSQLTKRLAERGAVLYRPLGVGMGEIEVSAVAELGGVAQMEFAQGQRG